MKVALLTGGDDPSYALQLLAALTAKGIVVDFIGNDSMQNSEAVRNENVNYLNLRGDQNPDAPIKEKIFRILKYYLALIKYAGKSDAKVFHILWLNRFVYLDRTILNVYYKLMGKKLVFTAHNVNVAERDGQDSLINRLTLRYMYNNLDHIFVHTNKMKQQLIENYSTSNTKITVIPFGINNFVSNSALTTEEAREKLELNNSQKILLFFGQIAPYKGLEYLIEALVPLKAKYNDFKLIIAGQIKYGNLAYWERIQRIIEKRALNDFIIKKIGFIPDEEVEVYFKSADVLVLPYKHIFQTGVTFLAYNFGLPVIATDVGSIKEDIIEGETGLISQPENPDDLAKNIQLYFQSKLYRNLKENRHTIMKYANERYSWEKVAEITHTVYSSLL